MKTLTEYLTALNTADVSPDVKCSLQILYTLAFEAKRGEESGIQGSAHLLNMATEIIESARINPPA
ncbi:hypothetical protein [Citrobacter portucalensis]|uniref:hypothetical protein n=1 Tax=Citrobacter portucalensis TaxID=1639133 RepID=UPI00226B0390|nr:hypothetical protein [Citrobacter portucalensis]MCX8985149.1 hypothetical protein [Citrobacter portucalensis]